MMASSSSSSKAAARPLKVGLVGGGVVGGGVYQLVERCAQSGRLGEVGASIDIAKICVKDATKKRDYEVKASTTFVTNVDDILNDPSINCVVELMGGVTTAKDVVFRAIAAGKHVVTANKALIAAFLPELMELLNKNPTVR